MSRWHSYDVASISFNRSIYSRLHKIPGVRWGGVLQNAAELDMPEGYWKSLQTN